MSLSRTSAESLPIVAIGSIAVLVLSTPLMTFQDDQLPLGMSLLFVGFALVVWTLRSYRWPRLAGWVLLGGLGVSVLSWTVTGQRYVTEVALAWLWAGALTFLVFHSWLAGRRISPLILWLMAGCSVMLVVPGWWSFVDLWQRATGFLYNSNGFGGAILWGLCMAIVLAAAGWHRRWTVPAAAVMMATFLLATSLTAMAAVAAPLGMVGWWYRRQIRWRLLALAAASVGVVVAVVWGVWRPPEIVHFMSTEHFRSSFSQRQEFNRVAFRMWQAKPLTGWGLGTYKQTFPRYTTQFNEQPLYAHNVYAQAFAETGIVGGLIWLILVVAIGRAGWRTIRRSDEGTERLILRGLFLGWLAFTLHAALDFSWHFPAGQVWWLLSSAVFVAGWRPTWVVERQPLFARTAVGVVALFVMGLATVVLTAITPTNRGQRAVNENIDATAIEQYQQAYRLTANPDTAGALAGVYWLRRTGDDLQVAERLLRSALVANGDDYFLHSALGHNLVAQRRLPEAIEAFATSTRLDPFFHPEFFYNYVVALKNDDRRAEAATVLRQALERYDATVTPNPIIVRQLPMLEQLRTELLPEGG